MSIITGGSSSPWSVPVLWDSIQIAGVAYGSVGGPSGSLPVGGRVVIKRASREYLTEKKNPQGSDGWTITYRGLKPKPFDLEFWIWTQAQYDYFTGSILPAIKLNGTKGVVQAVAIYHPVLAALDISQVFVDGIDGIEQISDDGMYHCVVHVTEYRPEPPANVTKTPTGAKSTNAATSPGVPPPTAVNNRLNVLARLKFQVAAGGAINPNFSGPI